LNQFGEILNNLTTKRIELANKYAVERKAYGETKSDLDILYAAKILGLTERKKNLGYEMGLLLMMADGGDVIKDLYKRMVTHYNNFKALERMIDAIESKIMAQQSLMRFYREQDGGQ